MVLIRAHSGFWSKPWSVTTVIRLHVGRPWTSIKQITQKCWMGFFCPNRLYYIDEMRPSWRPWLPSWRAVRDFCLYPGLRAESTGSGTGASWGPRHHLHHYTSCVWFRNPQLRWPLSQTLSSRMQIRRLSAVQFIRRDPACHWSHIYMSASMSVLGETFKAERMLGFGRSDGVFPDCKQQRCLNRNMWLWRSFHTCYCQVQI